MSRSVTMHPKLLAMTRAHQPYEHYPEQIKAVLAAAGHSAQVAGGVPSMCHGLTQGQDGMNLSLFSRV